MTFFNVNLYRYNANYSAINEIKKLEKTKEFYFRVEDYLYSIPDEYGDHHSTGHALSVSAYKFLKKTPQGVWLDLGFNDKKFVLETARKRFALPSFDEALESYLARKKKHRSIYKARLASLNVLSEIAETTKVFLEKQNEQTT